MKTLVFIALTTIIPASAGPIFSFTSFDGPGDNGGGTTVNGINANGQVVGFSSNGSATVFTNFIRNTDGTFTVLNVNNDPLAMANGLNNALTVVGGSNNAAFALNGALFSQLPNVNGTTAAEIAFGINNAGLVVGQYTDSSTGTNPGFLYSGGSFTILNPVANAAVTNAQGVNNNGLVTGFYSVDGVHQHGFFYNSGTSSFSLPPDPNIPNLVLTQFLGLNDLGIAVGYYQLPDGSQHGFLYNIATQTYTFLDDPNAATSGLSITQITGINDAGEITGFYVDANTGLQRGFIGTAVPEPGTLGLLLAALSLIPFLRRAAARVK